MSDDEGESFTLCFIPKGVEKTPFAHNELEMMTARHQTFSRNFGPGHVLV